MRHKSIECLFFFVTVIGMHFSMLYVMFDSHNIYKLLRSRAGVWN